MNNELITIAITISLLLGGLAFYNSGDVVLQGIEKERNAYSQAASYATSSVGLNSAVEVLVRATSSRSVAKICNLGAGEVYLYKQATSSGVVADAGIPLYASSSTQNNCLYPILGVNDPYTGAVWAISADATSTVSVERLQD